MVTQIRTGAWKAPDEGLREPELDRQGDELLLRAVVDVALEAATFVVLCRHQPLVEFVELVDPALELRREPRVAEDEPGLAGAMAPRAETESAVLKAAGVRGIVIRPGLVYGDGKGYDLPNLIALARKHGVAPHLGAGGVRQGYVHIDDLVELYVLALERAPAGTMLHAVTDEIAMGELAVSVSRLVGAGGRTEALSLMEMYGRGGGGGVSLSLNKRLASQKTRAILGWAPTRYDILKDVEVGSYAVHLLKKDSQ